MNRTNEELRERIVSKLSAKLAAHTPLGDTEILNAASITAHLLPLIQSYTNAEIAKVLDRIASKKNIYFKHAKYVTELNETPLVITTDYKYMIDLDAIQAERAKLKEVK